MTTLWFLIIGALLILMALASSMVKRLPLSTATLYLFIGVLLGPSGFGLIKLDPVRESSILELATEVAVIISLFSAGLKLRAPFSDMRWWLSGRLAVVAMLLTIALITLMGVFALGLSLGAALLLGAVLAPTDAVLAAAVQVENAGDRDRVRFSITGEAGLNDGITWPFVMLGMGLLGLHGLGDHGAAWFLKDVLWSSFVGVGAGWALGLMVGHAVLYLRRVHKEAVGLDEFLGLGLMALSYGTALLLEANGFLAVFAAGVALRRIEHRESGDKQPDTVVGTTKAGTADETAVHPEKAPAFMTQAVLSFNEQLERIGEVAVVLMIGGMLSVGYFTLEAVVVVPLLFFVIRPIAVHLSLVGSDTSTLQRNLMAWFGVRGIGSFYYLMYAVQHGLPSDIAHRLISLVLTVIAASIVVHGMSATPLMTLYSRLKLRRQNARIENK